MDTKSPTRAGERDLAPFTRYSICISESQPFIAIEAYSSTQVSLLIELSRSYRSELGFAAGHSGQKSVNLAYMHTRASI